MNAINNKTGFTNVVINSSLLAADQEISAGTFARIEYDGVEKLPKKLGINGEVTKHCVGTIQMRYSYENAVNNRIEKQGGERTFEAQGLKWGKWFIYNLFIAHKGETYMRFYTFNGGNLTFEYFVNGRPATEEENNLIRAYKANRDKTSHTQEDAGLIENQVRPCAVNTKNIIALDCGSYHYRRNDNAIQALIDAAEEAEVMAK